ncbi:MAG: SGNH/GDSL hydrolase family protein [bacterium]
MDTRSTRDKALVVLGVTYAALGIVCSPWILFPMLGMEDPPDLLHVHVLILLFDLAAIAWGVVTIRFRKRDFIPKLNLSLLTVCVFFPLCAEMFLRTSIALEVGFFRNPDLYADSLADDNYWKLHHKWVRQFNLPEVGSVHPLLGWAPPKNKGNPLGIVVETPHVPALDGKMVLFYGDSFVLGLTPMDKKIPQQLDRLLPNHTVLNYGVGGYGVDQIYLRFKETYQAYARPVILFGILTTDMDRCVLSIRTGQKPYFKLIDNELVLSGIPVHSRPNAWIKENPPQIRSYLCALLIQKLRMFSRHGNWFESSYKREEKQQLNSRIIQEVIRICRKESLPLMFVLFYTQNELGKNGWRAGFLKEIFSRAGVPYVDTEAVFIEAAQRLSCDISDFYMPRDGHPSELGNTVVAEEIAHNLSKINAL